MSTLTTISASDKVSDSRAVINTNFSTLNTDKAEASSGTLTSPTINTSISGTAFLDEDNMASNSATKVASQQSIKAYVDTKASTEKADLTKYSNLYAPEGFLVNGKIVPADAAGLTVAIKGMDGNDPSVTNPVYCRINGVVRSITTALSVAKADGTNWFNSGSAELATKEIDYFVYLGYNATDGVVVGFSRIPYANSYDDFSATTTNERYCAISTITNAAATDYYTVIGRFAATLSAGAGYTWTVPTFTATNLIQRPIYETRWLSWTPTLSYTAGGAPTGSNATYAINRYQIGNAMARFEFFRVYTGNGTTVTIQNATTPFTESTAITSGAIYPVVGYTINDSAATILNRAYVSVGKITLVTASSTVSQFGASGSFEI